MYILLTCISSIMITLLANKLSTIRWLSPTFLSGFMMSVFSLIYVATYNRMNSDITPKTCICIFGGLMCTAIGELLFHRARVNITNPKTHVYFYIIDIKKRTVYIYSFALILVFLYRLIEVWRLASSYGDFTGFFQMLATARGVYLETGIHAGGTISNQFVYISQFFSCYFAYAFFHNWLVMNNKRVYYLLPLIPDFIYKLSTTTRSSFIFLILTITVIIIRIRYIELKNPKPISKKLIIYVGIAFILLYIYGTSRTSYDRSIFNIVDYIQAYTNGSIYAFKTYLDKAATSNPYFGFYTLQGIYSSFGIKHSIMPSGLPHVFFNKNHMTTNTYTAFMKPIQDYGIFGMFILRFIESAIGTIILKCFFRSDMRKVSGSVLLYLSITMVLGFIYTPIDYAFIDYMWNPWSIIRYIVYGTIVYCTIIKPRNVDCT